MFYVPSNHFVYRIVCSRVWIVSYTTFNNLSYFHATTKNNSNCLNKWTEKRNAHSINVIYKHLIFSPLTVNLFVHSRTPWNKAVFTKCKKNTYIRLCSIQLIKTIYRISTLLKIIVNNFNLILVQFTCILLVILAHWHVHWSNCTIWNTMRRGYGIDTPWGCGWVC